jgi:hypothetical protein
MSLKAGLDQSRTPRERRAVVKVTACFFFGALGLLGVLYALRAAAMQWGEYGGILAGITQVFVLFFIVGWPVLLLRLMRHMRVLRSSERREHPELFQDPRDQVGSSAGEYRSRLRLLGVPLLHLRFSSPDEGERPVFGWIAGGDRAYGLLFAWGGLAIAPFSIGAVAIGFFALGSLSVGVISLGTAGVGLFAVGCMAVGVKAYGWLSAVGWQTAQGSGFSIARVAAEGPVAFAQNANDAVSHQMLADPNGAQTWIIILIIISILSVMPTMFYARAVRKRMGRKTSPGHDRAVV